MMKLPAGFVINFQEWSLLLLTPLQSVRKQQLKLIRFCNVEQLNAVAQKRFALTCLSPSYGQIIKQHSYRGKLSLSLKSMDLNF